MHPFLPDQTAASFDDPLEMLHACHGKILRQCDTLRKLAAHLPENGCDEPAQQAAQAILRYFDTAGTHHHKDEEVDLFPALRTCAEFEKIPVEPLLARLLTEHDEMLAAWHELRQLLASLGAGINVALPTALTERFIQSHSDHIAIEESELLPLAERLLDRRQLIRLGMHMAERRGARFPAVRQA